MGCTTSSPSHCEPVKSPFQIEFMESFRIGTVIGRGSSAEVRVAEALADAGEKRAVKFVDLMDPTAPCVEDLRLSRKFVQKEEQLWRKLGSHPNLVGLHGAFTVGLVHMFVMEYCEADVVDAIFKNAAGQAPSFSLIATSVLTGLGHMHHLRIVHRDIKPANILVAGGKVKIADFGAADVVPACGFLRGYAGSLCYMAPEVLNNERYDFTVDVWSLGVTLYALVYGGLPFGKASSRKEMAELVKAEATFDTPALVKHQYFLSKLFAFNRASRPSAMEALVEAYAAARRFGEVPSWRKVTQPSDAAGAQVCTHSATHAVPSKTSQELASTVADDATRSVSLEFSQSAGSS